MLSGGLDSSLIVALMAELFMLVKMFSAVSSRSRGNELADARLVSNLFSTEHYELELSFTRSGTTSTTPEMGFDEPIADLCGFRLSDASAVAAEHVTVALAGQGADELFGGYRKHRVASAFRGSAVASGGSASDGALAPRTDCCAAHPRRVRRSRYR